MKKKNDIKPMINHNSLQVSIWVLAGGLHWIPTKNNSILADFNSAEAKRV